MHAHTPAAVTAVIHLYPHRRYSPLPARSPWWAESPPAAEISPPQHIFLPKTETNPEKLYMTYAHIGCRGRHLKGVNNML